MDELVQADEEYVHTKLRAIIKNADFLLVSFAEAKDILGVKMNQDFVDEEELRVIEEEKFWSLMDWIQYKLEARRDHFDDLFRLLNLNFLSKKFLNEVVYSESLVKESMTCVHLILTNLLGRIPEECLHIRGESQFSTRSASEVNSPQIGDSSKALKEIEQKPSKLDQGHAETPEETQYVLDEARLILNKLTPDTFSELMEEFQQLPIYSELGLRRIIDLIFEKVNDDPDNSKMYANVCRMMAPYTITIPSTPNQSQQQTTTLEFHKFLLTRCEHEFEKHRQDDDVLVKLRQKLKEATTVTAKEEIAEETRLAEAKVRKEMFGNIKFIGELYMQKMLTDAIMHDCGMSLFKGNDNDFLECLCALLTIIGQDLELTKDEHHMSEFFGLIDKVIEEKSASPTICSVLENLMELRKNEWVPKPAQTQSL
ncbi:unnamed protein product [Clavelina lepadiformis]|uniref:MIF4G domain-containing protein n=1 Tax=Clavelina lepadiformis TaxID=159417 RepID=A0ABP0EYG8_CLALP